MAVQCPKNGPLAGYDEHDGLRTITSSGFKLKDTGTWSGNETLIDGLGLTKVPINSLNLNKHATKMGSRSWRGFKGGFYWASDDRSVAYWIPQGLAVGTSASRNWVVVAWHYSVDNMASDPHKATDGTNKGVRVSFAETTNMGTSVSYRHVLLVEPDKTRGFKPVPIHAGGLAWSGAYLYVADTYRGLRVFDLKRILQVTSAGCETTCGKSNGHYCAYGYSYVLPQVGGYYFPSTLASTCKPLFSFVTLDRSSTPDSILAGEYSNDVKTGIYSRILRWPVVESSDRLATSGGVATASGAWYAGSRNLQGVSAIGSKFFLNATRYSGALITGRAGIKSKVYRASNGDWAWMPEGMYVSMAGNIWANTEGHASLARCVFYADTNKIP